MYGSFPSWRWPPVTIVVLRTGWSECWSKLSANQNLRSQDRAGPLRPRHSARGSAGPARAERRRQDNALAPVDGSSAPSGGRATIDGWIVIATASPCIIACVLPGDAPVRTDARLRGVAFLLRSAARIGSQPGTRFCRTIGIGSVGPGLVVRRPACGRSCAGRGPGGRDAAIDSRQADGESRSYGAQRRRRDRAAKRSRPDGRWFSRRTCWTRSKTRAAGCASSARGSSCTRKP